MTTPCIIDPLSIEGEIVLKELWGQTSAKLDETSILYKIRRTFVSKLLKTGVASSNDIDLRNTYPYIHLVLPSDDQKNLVSIARDRFNLLQNATIKLIPESLIICQDHVEIQLLEGVCMTIFYKRGLCDPINVMPLKQLWIESLRKLITNKASE